MKFYYRPSQIPEHEDPYTYYTDEEINSMTLYPETPDLLELLEKDPDADFWPVYNVTGWSWEAMECRDEKHARRELGICLNQSVYEYINDI